MFNQNRLIIIVSGSAAAVLVALGIFFVFRSPVTPPLPINPGPGPVDKPPVTQPVDLSKVSVRPFTSESEFKEYLVRASSAGGFGVKTLAMPSARAMEDSAAPQDFGLNSLGTSAPSAAPEPDRVSTTNVQVVGIDEPDIVKTDGKVIYVSSPNNYYYGWRGGPVPMAVPEEDVRGIMPPQTKAGVRSITAFPPADLKVLGTIDATGDLLLVGSTLISFQYNNVVAYNVANPAKAEQSWSIDFKDNAQFVAARLNQGKLYLITRRGVDPSRPCPFVAFEAKGRALTIPCTDIYHPDVPVAAESTYTVAAIDPATGDAADSISFVGTYQEAPVYMSKDALYVTYGYPGDQVGYLFNFLKQNTDLVPSWLIDRVGKLIGYDISDEAKMMELMRLLERWEQPASSDERLKLENEMQNRLSSYAKSHNRELQYTGIVKVSVPQLSVVATGSIPGSLLNQFSLDEYQGNLRVATTVGQSWFFGSTGAESVSDVYVLDSGLKQIGSVLDLGRGERIYSVRFVAEEGYVVTFRQTDPFYVIDLKLPADPKLAGELKIPGFSSYLHPLAENIILGVGQESGKVKLSLFDVSDPKNPKETAKYMLDDYWSEVSSNHHAFLQDAKHSVFYMPGGKGGYIFSYKPGELKLTKAVSNITARRALYLNDYLYVVGDDRIVVLSESDWERVKELVF